MDAQAFVSLGGTGLALISADAIFGAVISVGVVVSGAFITLLIRNQTNRDSLTRIEKILEVVDISTMHARVEELWEDRRATWDFLRHRGDSEAEMRGYGKRRSPLAILPESEALIMKTYEPFFSEMKAIEIENKLDSACDADEPALWKAIAASHLSKRFSELVCPVLGVHEGACVSLAIAAMKRHKQCGTK